MKYYTCYETDKMEYADGYENAKIAQEYAEEAKSEGYTNVRVLSEEEVIAEGKFKI